MASILELLEAITANPGIDAGLRSRAMFLLFKLKYGLA